MLIDKPEYHNNFYYNTGGITLTLQELNDYPYIVASISEMREKITDLYDNASGLKSPIISDMPHGSVNTTSPVEEGYESVGGSITYYATKLKVLEEKKERIEKFFSEIPTEHLRKIFKLKFMDELSWSQVARKIGGNNTKDSVKKICYRYLKTTEKVVKN